MRDPSREVRERSKASSKSGKVNDRLSDNLTINRIQEISAWNREKQLYVFEKYVLYEHYICLLMLEMDLIRVINGFNSCNYEQ
jgi:hypothetical protein